MFSNFKSISFVSAVALSTVGAFATPAAAGTIVANTPTGAVPNAYATVEVNAADFQGPGANDINLPPISFLYSSAVTYNVAANVIFELSNASISFSNFSDLLSGVAFAARNGDGSVGTFHRSVNTSIQVLSDKILIMAAADEAPWSYVKIENLVLTQAAALGTPNTDIILGGLIYNTSNTITFETISPTALITSKADVPTPGAAVLLGVGLLGLGCIRRKTKPA